MGRWGDELGVWLESKCAIGAVESVCSPCCFALSYGSRKAGLSRKNETTLCTQYESTCRDVVTEHYESVNYRFLQRARRVGRCSDRHPHRVIPLVDINGGSGNAAGQRAGEESGSHPDFFSGKGLGER